MGTSNGLFFGSNADIFFRGNTWALRDDVLTNKQWKPRAMVKASLYGRIFDTRILQLRHDILGQITASNMRVLDRIVPIRKPIEAETHQPSISPAESSLNSLVDQIRNFGSVDKHSVTLSLPVG